MAEEHPTLLLVFLELPWLPLSKQAFAARDFPTHAHHIRAQPSPSTSSVSGFLRTRAAALVPHQQQD